MLYIVSMNGAEIIQQIVKHLNGDPNAAVQITTYTKSTVYGPKHVGMFKVGKSGSPLVQRGKHWDDISGCKIQFGKWS